MEIKREPRQPSFLDNQGRPDSAIVSQNIDQELEKRFPMEEQRNRIKSKMQQDGLTMEEAARELGREDSTDYQGDYGSKK